MKAVGLAVIMLLVLALAGCSSSKTQKQPDFDKGATPASVEATATPISSAGATSTPPLARPTDFVVPPTPAGPPTATSGGSSGARPPAPVTPGPVATLQARERAEPAPIDGIDVQRIESAPPRYSIDIRAGAPDGCTKQLSSAIERTGDSFKVTVLNAKVVGNIFCTQIYTSYELNLILPGSFVAGTTYTINVNDKFSTFTAK